MNHNYKDIIIIDEYSFQTHKSMKCVSKSELITVFDSFFIKLHFLMVEPVYNRFLSLFFIRKFLSIWEQSECLNQILN